MVSRSTTLTSLHWQQSGELNPVDLEQVLACLSRTMDTGAEELSVLLARQVLPLAA